MPEMRNSRWFAEHLPRPDVLDAVLKDDPVARLLNVARDRAIVDGDLVAIPKKKADEEKVEAMLNTAKAAAARLSKDPNAKLSKKEKDALDLFILLVSRPAIFVRGGDVKERPENWPEVKEEKELLPGVIAGVGRIEMADHFKIGTGFIAGENCILTNNHVVCGLFGLDLMAWKKARPQFETAMTKHNKSWKNDEDTRPWFDLRGEFGSKAHARTRITKVLGSHTDVDMAVLELDHIPDYGEKLTLAKNEPAKIKGRHVYVVGYPVADLGTIPAPIPILRRVFGKDESLGTKRFSPGTLIGWESDHELRHDASTLAGSSGSCVVDFDDHQVVALHFSGYYGTRNLAVPLWKFRNDVLLTKNGVIFG